MGDELSALLANQKQIGLLVNRLRLEAGTSSVQIAKHAGISQPQLCRL